MSYNRALGNTYTASLYFALTAQLHNNEGLAGKRLGFFSYGSGAVAEFFTGVVQENYRDHIYPEHVAKQLENRVELTYDEYRTLHSDFAATSETYTTQPTTHAPFRLSGVTEFQRRYEAQCATHSLISKHSLPPSATPWPSAAATMSHKTASSR